MPEEAHAKAALCSAALLVLVTMLYTALEEHFDKRQAAA